jgi:ABC-type transport system involved in multi-copper enzyme maturation permease subunit
LGILILALGFIASALLLASLAIDQQVRVILDWGLFCISAFGVLLAILMGVSQVHKEIRRKNLYVVLTRPIHRWQYVFGKYLGMAFTLLIEVSALALALVALLAMEGLTPSPLLVKALLLILVEILVVGALAVFFASFSSPYLSGLFTLGIFIAGRSLDALEKLAGKIIHPVLSALFKALVFILPDFGHFNLSNRVVHQIALGWQEVAWLVAYGLGYLATVLFLSAWIFSKRDLT